MRGFLQAAVNKLINSFKEDVREVYNSYFTEARIKMLEESGPLKIQLYSYYLEKNTTYVKIKDLLQKIKEYFDINDNHSSEASLPKIEQSIFSEFSLKQEETCELNLTDASVKIEQSEVKL